MMTDQEAISLAKRVAEVEGWQWREPVAVTKVVSRRTTRDQRKHDLVVSTGCVDCSITVRIDPDSGSVLDGSFHGGRKLPVSLDKWAES